MSVSITIEGLQSAVETLEKIQEGMGTASVRRVLKDGAVTMTAFLKQAAPRRTGALQRSVRAKLAPPSKSTVAVAWVQNDQIEFPRSPKGREYRYPYIVDAGSPAHTIRPVRGKALRIGKSFRGAVKHPGFAPTRYFSKGARRGKPFVKQQIETDLQRIIRAAI